MVGRHSLPGRLLNANLTEQVGREVVKLEAIPIVAGQRVRFEIESATSPWRQGVRFATHGVLIVNTTEGPQLDLWMDTAPAIVEMACASTDGLLRFHNIWQSGRRPGVESLSHTSGMLVDALADGSRRYSCNDIGLQPDFQKLVFRVSVL
jgi:hypothetical protein